MGLPSPGVRSSTLRGSDASSEKLGNEIEGFGGRVVRLRTVLLQQILDTGCKLRSCEWLGNVIVTAIVETPLLGFTAIKRGHS